MDTIIFQRATNGGFVNLQTGEVRRADDVKAAIERSNKLGLRERITLIK